MRSRSVGSAVNPAVSSITETRAAATMPKLFTNASTTSSRFQPLVVGKNSREIAASGSTTVATAAGRDRPSLSRTPATMTSTMEIRDVKPAKASAPGRTAHRSGCRTAPGR